MNPQMLTLLRESRGLSGAQLAKESGVPQPTISKMENNLSPMEPGRITAIAEALGYPIEAFNWSDQVYGFGSSSFYHRKQQTLPQTKLRKIQATVNLLRMRLSRLLKGVAIDARFTLPSIDVDELGSPSEVARAVRALWMLPMGPVKSMTTTLEQAGVVVIHSNFESPKISAISNIGVDGVPAFVVLNVGMPADRERFTLAHELGHLVMHSTPDLAVDAEREADEFASEFLMPAAEIRSQLRALNLNTAFALKMSWRVSIAALIRRARDLGQIDDARYKSLNVLRSKKGWHRDEPGTFDHERPTVIQALINVPLDEHGFTVPELAEVLGLSEDEFRSIYDRPASPRRAHLQVV